MTGTFNHPLKPGLYVLREKFVSTKVDRRLSGYGFGTLKGFPKGTTFTLLVAPWRGENDYVLRAPFVSGREGSEAEVCGFLREGSEDISWGSPLGVNDLADVERLFNLLDPDNTDESFVNNTVGRSYSSEGDAACMLMMLLGDGVLTREVISTYAEKMRKHSVTKSWSENDQKAKEGVS